jgi:hypothetical protein
MLFHRQQVMQVSSRRAITIVALTALHFIRTVAAAPHDTMQRAARLRRLNAAFDRARRHPALSTMQADTVLEYRARSSLRCTASIKLLPVLNVFWYINLMQICFISAAICDATSLHT